MGIISWLVWGLFVGLLARGLTPGRQAIGCWWTIALGIAGSAIGGLVATKLLHIGNTSSFGFGNFVIAVATSVALLVLWGIYERRREARNPPPAY
jgi:uncharacterized membrane protein YeaQ/YmgE (transglycosylase-associated protein family)